MIFFSNDVWHNLITNRQFLWHIGLVFRRICKIVMSIKNWNASGRGRDYATSNRGRGGQGSPLPPRASLLRGCLSTTCVVKSWSTLSFPPLILNNEKVEKSISFSGLYSVEEIRSMWTISLISSPEGLPSCRGIQQVGIKLLTC